MELKTMVNEILDHHKITKYRLSKMTGISTQTFNSIINGDQKDIGLIKGKGLQLLKLHPKLKEIIDA